HQAADAAGADLDEIATALARGEADPPVVVGLHDRRRSLTEPAFIGRRADLGSLERALVEARLGRGGLVAVEADSGGGKTRLIEELAQRAMQQGAWVLRGRGVDLTAQRPLQALDGVMREVAEGIAAEPVLGEELRERLTDEKS